MRHWVLISCFCFLSAAAPPAPHKKAPVGKKVIVPRYGSKHKAPAANSTKAPAARKTGTARHAVIRAAAPTRQVAPSNDRYREIQEALASKGYLATPPTGQWDQNSQDAMRRFQADQKLDSTGKLTSRSIIALGLGSPSSATPPAPKQ